MPSHSSWFDPSGGYFLGLNEGKFDNFDVGGSENDSSVRGLGISMFVSFFWLQLSENGSVDALRDPVRGLGISDFVSPDLFLAAIWQLSPRFVDRQFRSFCGPC